MELLFAWQWTLVNFDNSLWLFMWWWLCSLWTSSMLYCTCSSFTWCTLKMATSLFLLNITWIFSFHSWMMSSEYMRERRLSLVDGIWWHKWSIWALRLAEEFTSDVKLFLVKSPQGRQILQINCWLDGARITISPTSQINELVIS